MKFVPGNSSQIDPLLRHSRLIMVVDADQHHLLYHATLLQRFEYRVCTARSVMEALEMAGRTVPSLIVTELELPQMNGLDLLRQIRKNERTMRVPVVALIEDLDQMAEMRSLREGFHSCLKKPVGAEELYRTVQAAVEPRPRGNMRIQAKLPVTVNNIPLDCVEGECASVISEHGMYIRTRTPHPPKAHLSVKIALNGRTIVADAVVLYSHRFGEGPFGEPGMGIKFDRIAPHDQEHLRSFIHGHMSGVPRIQA